MSSRPRSCSASRVRLRLLAPRIRRPNPSWYPAVEGEVLPRVEHPDQAEVLVDEADAGIARGLPVAERERLAVDPRLRRRRVGLVVAGEDLDQGRLAGAVLADERMHLTRSDVDADVVQGDLSGEGLRTGARCGTR